MEMENEVKKVESSWPTSKICLENSEWMAKNVNGFLTPEKKLGMQNVEDQVPSELCLSSGGGISDVTPNEGSESSLLSSDSDSESYDLSPEKMQKHEIVNLGTQFSEQENETIKGGESGEYEMLKRKILDYEKELRNSKEKLELAEDEIARQKKQLENKEAIIVKISSIEAQLVTAQNQLKMNEAEMEEESKRSLNLQRQILDLEAKLESEKTQVQKLEKELLDRDDEIEKLNASFTVEKQQFESSITMLSQRLSFHEAKTNELQKQCESFEAEKVEMLKNQEALKASWQDNTKELKIELRDKDAIVDTLNENLDSLKLHYEMVMLDKDSFKSKWQALRSDLSIRDDQIQCTERKLNELRSENAGAKKVIDELKSRISELEKDVGMKKVEICEIGEEKREAIRQLCFSLDHFRSMYQQLRDVHAVSKRRTGMLW